MSMVISSVGHQWIATIPCCITSWMKWNWTSICFDCAWNCGFAASAITNWLSMCNSDGLAWVNLSAVRKFHSQMICFVARVAAIYSASIDNKATMDCFFEVYEIALPPIRNVYPEIDFWSISFKAQPASEKLDIAMVALPLHWSYIIPMSLVPCRYLNKCFTACQCSLDGLWEHCDRDCIV